MVARGADVSWLSMYPNEAEVLFPPICAMEVMKSRCERSMIIVELRPGVATSGLAERSAEEKLEDDRRKAIEQAARDADKQKAIDMVSRTKVAWARSMDDVKLAALEAKRAAQELETAKFVQAALEAKGDAAAKEEKAAAMEKERDMASRNLKAVKQLKAMEEEERKAADDKEEARRQASEKLQKARAMGEYIKKAALRQRLADEQEALRKQVAETQASQRSEEAARELMQARLFASNSRAMGVVSKLKEDAAAGADELGNQLKEIMEEKETLESDKAELEAALSSTMKKLSEAQKAVDEVQHRADGYRNEINSTFQCEEVMAINSIKNPTDMAEGLEGWLADSRCTKTACEAIGRFADKRSKDAKNNKKKLLQIGAIEKLVRTLQTFSREEPPLNVVGVCASLGQLTNSLEGAKRAMDADIIPPLVTAVRTVLYTCTKPLMNLVSLDDEVAIKARENGAKEDWFTLPDGAVAATPGGDEEGDGDGDGDGLSRQKSSKQLSKGKSTKALPVPEG